MKGNRWEHPLPFPLLYLFTGNRNGTGIAGNASGSKIYGYTKMKKKMIRNMTGMDNN